MGGISFSTVFKPQTRPLRGAHSSYTCIEIVSAFSLCLVVWKFVHRIKGASVKSTLMTPGCHGTLLVVGAAVGIAFITKVVQISQNWFTRWPRDHVMKCYVQIFYIRLIYIYNILRHVKVIPYPPKVVGEWQVFLCLPVSRHCDADAYFLYIAILPSPHFAAKISKIASAAVKVIPKNVGGVILIRNWLTPENVVAPFLWTWCQVATG